MICGSGFASDAIFPFGFRKRLDSRAGDESEEIRMITNPIKCAAVCLVLLIETTSCAGWLARRCIKQQHRGNVFMIQGEVEPGGTSVHTVIYGTDGSQNNVNISWNGQTDPEGPRLRIYATRTECMNSTEVGRSGMIRRRNGQLEPPCGEIGMRGGRLVGREFVPTGITITNGRGNPDILGSPAEYKIWVFGDQEESVSYTIDSSYFFGPDC